MEDIETEVRKLLPEDGDVIVLRAPRPLRMEQRVAIATAARDLVERLAKKVEFLVLDDGMSIEVLKTSVLADREVSA